MRNAFGLMLASVVAAVVIAGVWFWTSSPRADAALPQTVAARTAEPLPAPPSEPPRGTTSRSPLRSVEAARRRAAAPVPPPAEIGLRQSRSRSASARTVVIDTTGGPGFGFLQYKQFDFLTDKEVVLTFDDGPWPTTPAVLKALADECTKARVLPDRQARDLSSGDPEAGRGRRPHHRRAHTWSHAHLDSKKLTEQQARGRDRERL